MSFLTHKTTEEGWEYVQLPSKESVSVLPYRRQFGLWEFLVLSTYNPAWKSNEFECVTGLVDKQESILDAAVRELYEETGYMPSPGHLRHLDDSFVARFSDLKVDMYAVEITGRTHRNEERVTDGTKFESTMVPTWIPQSMIAGVNDPILKMTYLLTKAMML